MTVWAAAATREAGDLRAALTLLLDARHAEPTGAQTFDAWHARKTMFDIVLSSRPERERLEVLLADLRAYAAGRSVPPADLPVLDAQLLNAIGDRQGALARRETAWQVHNGDGYMNSWNAYDAARLCLELDRPAACRDWIEAMSRAGDDNHVKVTIEQTQRRLDLAMAERDPRRDLTAKLRSLTDLTLTIQDADLAADLRDYAVRVHLLDPQNGGPAHRLHPAWGELRRRLPHRRDVHYRFAARLLFLDYRLACLRHAAGLPAVDDKYYRQPDDLTRISRVDQHSASTTPPEPGAIANGPSLPSRLHKARAAADWAMVYARKLDGWLQCDWRQLKVADRRERIEAIARAVGLGP